MSKPRRAQLATGVSPRFEVRLMAFCTDAGRANNAGMTARMVAVARECRKAIVARLCETQVVSSG